MSIINSVENKFAPFKKKMENEGLSEIVINSFYHYYQLLAEGGSSKGIIHEDSIEPIESIADLEDISNNYFDLGKQAISKMVMLKLNGGLGTSMGLDRAKSLLEVKNGMSFLEIIIRQALDSNIPLVLMNSFRTRADCLEIVSKFPELLSNQIPIDFLQHKVPKIVQKDLSPVTFHTDRELEWCPPGHGDIYSSLVTSGMLSKLIENGYEYLFVSNSDNLGATIDYKLLGYFSKRNLPFMMEVANRTEADKKGGHLAGQKNHQLILREFAQCSEKDSRFFQDIKRYKYFNTNNLWINLNALSKLLKERNNNLALPLICNKKTVDPRDKKSEPVYQLETAMGAAISVFPKAEAIRVPRSRFLPVKKTNDLLKIRSDYYDITKNFRLELNPNNKYNKIRIDLDQGYFSLIRDFNARFPYGIPSLSECKDFVVIGDVKFGKNVKIQGKVKIENTKGETFLIEDNSILKNNNVI